MTLMYYNEIIRSNGHYRFFQEENRAKSLPIPKCETESINATNTRTNQININETNQKALEPQHHHHEWRIYNYEDYNIEPFQEELPPRLQFALVPNREPELVRRMRDNEISFRARIFNFRKFKSVNNI